MRRALFVILLGCFDSGPNPGFDPSRVEARSLWSNVSWTNGSYSSTGSLNAREAIADDTAIYAAYSVMSNGDMEILRIPKDASGAAALVHNLPLEVAPRLAVTGGDVLYATTASRFDTTKPCPVSIVPPAPIASLPVGPLCLPAGAAVDAASVFVSTFETKTTVGNPTGVSCSGGFTGCKYPGQGRVHRIDRASNAVTVFGQDKWRRFACDLTRRCLWSDASSLYWFEAKVDANDEWTGASLMQADKTSQTAVEIATVAADTRPVGLVVGSFGIAWALSVTGNQATDGCAIMVRLAGTTEVVEIVRDMSITCRDLGSDGTFAYTIGAIYPSLKDANFAEGNALLRVNLNGGAISSVPISRPRADFTNLDSQFEVVRIEVDTSHIIALGERAVVSLPLSIFP